MFMKVYISYKDDEYHALDVGKQLLQRQYMPFVPRMHKLVDGLSDEQWVAYYDSWIYSCDVLWASATARERELQIARNFGIPVVKSFKELEEVKLPRYGELCREFAMYINTHLEGTDPEENWRMKPVDEVLKEFEGVVGRSCDDKFKRRLRAVAVATLALKAWDIER